jgi:hypothetical protein
MLALHLSNTNILDYLRGESSMIDPIGGAAGELWQYLNTQGASSATKITKETSLDSKSIQRAIGWLAKEGKLEIIEKGRTELLALK